MCDEADLVNDLHVAEPGSTMNMFELNSDPGSSEAVIATVPTTGCVSPHD